MDSTHHIVSTYIGSLRRAQSIEEHVILMRRYWPERYFELCKTHLSHLIDIPCDLLEFDSTNKDWVDVDTYATPYSTHTACEMAVDVSSSWMEWMKLSSSLDIISSTSSSYDKMSSKSENLLLSNHLNNNAAHQQRSTKLTQLLSKMFATTSTKSIGKPGDEQSRSVNERVVNEMMRICAHLSLPQYLQSKGLFRISGNHARVQQIKTFLLDSTLHNVPLQVNKYTVHDLACGMKAVLGDLGQSVFTAQLLPFYTQVAQLTISKDQQTEMDTQLAQAKQLKAIRILFLLLPIQNQKLVKALFNLLHLVSKEPLNAMSSSSLGLLFAPHLLISKNSSSTELRDNYAIFSEFIALLINNAHDLFMVPTTLSDQLKAHWESRCQKLRHLATTSCSTLSNDHEMDSLYKSNDDEEDDDPILHNAPAFVTRRPFAVKSDLRPEAQQKLSPLVESIQNATKTEYAVAELYAQVQSMPDCVKKRQLIHRFNKTNGGLTSPRDCATSCASPAPTTTTSTASSTTFSSRGITLGGLRSSIRKRMALSQFKSFALEKHACGTSSVVLCETPPRNDVMPKEPEESESCFPVSCSPFKRVRFQSTSAIDEECCNNDIDSPNDNEERRKPLECLPPPSKRCNNKRPSPARLTGIRNLTSPNNALHLLESNVNKSPRCSALSDSSQWRQTASPMAYAH